MAYFFQHYHAFVVHISSKLWCAPLRLQRGLSMQKKNVFENFTIKKMLYKPFSMKSHFHLPYSPHNWTVWNNVAYWSTCLALPNGDDSRSLWCVAKSHSGRSCLLFEMISQLGASAVPWKTLCLTIQTPLNSRVNVNTRNLTGTHCLHETFFRTNVAYKLKTLDCLSSHEEQSYLK